MHQIKYRFIDSKGKTRKTAIVTFIRDMVIGIRGTATDLQVYAAIDGNADSIGKLKITQEYIESI